MDTLAFSLPGRFWRGNLHTHSTRSDGHRTPEQICALYREARYDFIALTDHFMARYGFPITDTTPYRRDDFTTLLGAELHTGQTEFGLLWHILAVGLPSDFAPYPPGETGPEVAARALAAGAYVAAAHPSWYGITEADIRSLGAIDAVEIFNGTAIDHNDKSDSVAMLDLLLTRGQRVNACATDDAHCHPDRHDALRGWVYVKSETLEPAALLSALKAGAYYSSTGPLLHDIEVTPDQKVVVRCSPVDRLWITGSGSSSVSMQGRGLTHAELSLEGVGSSPYIRVTVRGSAGERAWSNPIWL